MSELLMAIQLVFMVAMTIYICSALKGQQAKRTGGDFNNRANTEKLDKMRAVALTEPLTEKTRPRHMKDIIGQEDGVRALLAALCGRNPQHIIIYGPPGVGKTCAARLALEAAKRSKGTPFLKEAKFIEMDATCVRFDERSIADPLIGSVHDPIYQGAGAYGQAGIPQPRAGAVTKAHGGVLFLDEIGELHPVQMNKLLKVMEDRKVFFESAYYTENDKNIPPYIHEIFQKGMPADFRLIGATTRSAAELPAALRSRCIEVYFRPLYEDELVFIAKNAAKNGGMAIEEQAAELVAEFSSNGRDAVNMVQMALGIGFAEDRDYITRADIEWIAQAGRYQHRPSQAVEPDLRVGYVNGLAVSSASQGFLIEIEASATPTEPGRGTLCVTGFVEQEESDGGSRRFRRKSTAVGSIQNVLTVLGKYFGIRTCDYDLHINAVGGMAVDGPSAGIAICACLYSAITGLPIPGDIAMTGEISLSGRVNPVGGVSAKLEAALHAGAATVFIPVNNLPDWAGEGIDVKPVETIRELFSELFPVQEHTAVSLEA